MSSHEPTPRGEPRREVSGQGLGVVPLLFSSPSEAFRCLAADPKWLGPFVLFLVLMAVGSWMRMPQDVVAQEEMMITVLERAGAGPEDIDEALARTPDPENLTTKDISLHVVQVVGTMAVLGFVGVLVFWLVARLVGPQPGFTQASAVYWTVSLATGVGFLVLAFMVRAADSVEVSLGPAALVPGLEWGSLPYLFLDLFNVFALLTLFLLAVGARWVFGTSKGTGWVIGGVYWGLAALVTLVIGAIGAFATGRL